MQVMHARVQGDKIEKLLKKYVYDYLPIKAGALVCFILFMQGDIDYAVQFIPSASQRKQLNIRVNWDYATDASKMTQVVIKYEISIAELPDKPGVIVLRRPLSFHEGASST